MLEPGHERGTHARDWRQQQLPVRPETLTSESSSRVAQEVALTKLVASADQPFKTLVSALGLTSFIIPNISLSKGVVSRPHPFLRAIGSKVVSQPVDFLVIMAYLS
jgi:hypothetical protein